MFQELFLDILTPERSTTLPQNGEMWSPSDTSWKPPKLKWSLCMP